LRSAAALAVVMGADALVIHSLSVITGPPRQRRDPVISIRNAERP